MSETRTLAILLGASEFPYSAGLGGGEAFENSAQDFRQYLHDPKGLDLPLADVLNLFDDKRPAGTLLELIIEFLDQRQSRKTSTNVERLLVYYVGHGGFTPVGQEYFLAVHSTRERNEGPSSIRISDLGHIIRDNARVLCQYLILDCCFSAQAYSAFQSGPGDAAITKTLDSVPKRGTALLCSSGPKDVSLAPVGCKHTMFSEALLNVLEKGDPSLHEYLSLSDVGMLIEKDLRDEYQDGRVRPQVHCPNQPEGDLSLIPIFPNSALKSRSSERTRVALEILDTTELPRDFAAATQSSLRNVRLGAVQDLVELVRSTSSLELANLAHHEIVRISEEDDSNLVRMTAKDALLDCVLPPPPELLKSRPPNTQNLVATTAADSPPPSLREATIDAELAMAASIQESLLRISPPDVPYATVKGTGRACREVGGDFLDAISTKEGLYLVVGDVSGKGIAAALLSSLLQGILYSELSNNVFLSQAAATANRYLIEKVGGQRYATVTIARLQADGTLDLLNCGGVFPVLISGQTVKSIHEAACLPIGLLESVRFDSIQLHLQSGDRVLMMTDGITEAENSREELFGEERISQSIVLGFDALENALLEFREGTPQFDDYAMAEITYRG